MSHVVMQAGLATLVLMALQIALSFLAPAAAREGGGGGFGFWLASSAITAALLTAIARSLRAPRKWRPLVLWGIWGGIQANSLVELLIFDIGIPRADLAWLTADLLAVSAAFCAFVGLVFRPRPSADEPPVPAAVPAWWRLALCILIYEALYFTAGRLAWPYLQAFYSARPMPSVVAISALQIVRGLGFALVVRLLIQQLRAGRGQVALVAGLTLSLVGGVAPLLVPNVYLPDAVRLAHLPEVGLSNFLFGWIAGWLLSARRREARPPSYLAVAT